MEALSYSGRHAPAGSQHAATCTQVVDAETQKAMLAFYYKKQEEQQESGGRGMC
jgi:hypothetical protein